jgi:hypothetical protein
MMTVVSPSNYPVFHKGALLSMETGIFYAHSGWRYIVIVLLVITIVKMLIGLSSRGRWGNLDEWLNRLTPISIDIQFLLGLVLWIMQQRWIGADPLASWEHPVTMLIASILAHVTQARTRRAPTDASKYQTAFIGYLIAGLIVALGVARITRVL